MGVKFANPPLELGLKYHIYIYDIYLHDPPPFNCPFFMTPPFSEAQKVVTPPPPLLISDKSLSRIIPNI